MIPFTAAIPSCWGIPSWWREQAADAVADPRLHAVLQKVKKFYFNISKRMQEAESRMPEEFKSGLKFG